MPTPSPRPVHSASALMIWLGATQSDMAMLTRLSPAAYSKRVQRRRSATHSPLLRDLSDWVSDARQSLEADPQVPPHSADADLVNTLRMQYHQRNWELLRCRSQLAGYERRYVQLSAARALVLRVQVPAGHAEESFMRRWLDIRLSNLNKRLAVCSLRSQHLLRARIAGLEAQVASLRTSLEGLGAST